MASPEGDSFCFSGLTPHLRAGLMAGVAEATGSDADIGNSLHSSLDAKCTVGVRSISVMRTFHQLRHRLSALIRRSAGRLPERELVRAACSKTVCRERSRS